MKHKRSLSKVLSLAVALGLFVQCFSLNANAKGAKPAYEIGNPYAHVEWDEWEHYKTQLHCHTNASDGDIPLNEQIEEHYDLGYDILAITDHMTLGVRWDQVPRTVPLMRLIKYDRTQMLPVTPLTSERRAEILAGVGRGGRGMLEVTTGIELNGAVPSNNHVNGYFTDYGQGMIGVEKDYETPIKNVHERGGITFIDHPGNTSGAPKSEDPETFYAKSPDCVNKYANLFLNYSSCVGIDINSGTDAWTKYDRLLYDEILQKTIPHGVVPWSFTFSDGHQSGQFDRAFTVHMMKEFTVDDLRRSMEEGTFFGFSRHPRYEKDDDFVGEGTPPIIYSIDVNKDAGTINIEAGNFDTIAWVSDGKVFYEGRDTTLKLSDYDDEIGSYVRAYLLGPGGILYIQPFTVLREGQVLEKEEIVKKFDLSVLLRGIVNIIIRLSPNWTPWRKLWNIISLFDPYIDLPWLTKLLY